MCTTGPPFSVGLRITLSDSHHLRSAQETASAVLTEHGLLPPPHWLQKIPTTQQSFFLPSYRWRRRLWGLTGKHRAVVTWLVEDSVRYPWRGDMPWEGEAEAETQWERISSSSYCRNPKGLPLGGSPMEGQPVWLLFSSPKAPESSSRLRSLANLSPSLGCSPQLFSACGVGDRVGDRVRTVLRAYSPVAELNQRALVQWETLTPETSCTAAEEQ